MSNNGWIRGAGGGGKGGGGGTAKEDDDTLFSDSKARVIDLLSEGEIIGLLSAQKSIYLNETPLQDSAGNSNFDDVAYSTREGTNSQAYIPEL
jgi:predicted phage tail protein